ncbi:MAG: type II toxin-antitoxin system HicA family toxin [Cyanobacteriota bacterium]
MVNGLTNVRFNGHNPLKQQLSLQQNSMVPLNRLSQLQKDEVAFTGAVLNLTKLAKAAKVAGLDLVNTGGKHGVKLLGKGRPIPVPVHGGGEIATGTANSIAKQMGFKNVRDLLSKI